MSAAEGMAAEGWAQRRERGTLFLMKLCFLGLRWLPRPVMLPFVRLAVLYFLVFGRAARMAAFDYLARAGAACAVPGLGANWRSAWRLYREFGDAILDRLDAWLGRLGLERLIFEDFPLVQSMRESGRGALIIGSHLGNLEVFRALGELNSKIVLNVLLHTRHAGRYNEILAQAGASQLRLWQVTSLDAATTLKLRERIAAGEWVFIAGDRVPVHGGRTIEVDFLGSRAPLPIGPYILASVLECPVYLMFCLREGRRYRIVVERFAERLSLPRPDRQRSLADWAQRYAGRLEHWLRRAPLQWFNFYPFWQPGAGSKADA